MLFVACDLRRSGRICRSIVLCAGPFRANSNPLSALPFPLKRPVQQRLKQMLRLPLGLALLSVCALES